MERFTNRIFKTFFNRRPKEEKYKFFKPGSNPDSLNNKRKNTPKMFKNLYTLQHAEMQLLLDNVVYPEDMDYDEVTEGEESVTMCGRDETDNNYYSKKEILCVVYDQGRVLENKSSKDTKQTPSKKLRTTDFAKHMPTFWRLKRKLQNIENVYPELYYRDQNIFEMFANSHADKIVRSEVEDVDGLLWI